MLPNISSAAYVYSTNQSAVQVTYVDASTAIVYPNEFTNPRTQQLNDWVRGGGQISPFVPEPRPVPGPPQFISLVPTASLNGVTDGTVINNWLTTDSLGLTCDGTYVTLQAGRTYEISYTVAMINMSSPTWMRFGIVTSTGAYVPTPGTFRYNALVWGLPPSSSTGQNEAPSQTFLYTPTVSTQVGLKCLSTSGGNTTGALRLDFSSLVITEVVDESIYASKQGPQGPAGPIGPAGPQGLAGPPGPTGPQGTQGVAGPQGVQGPAGQPGPGFTFLGTVATSGDLPTPATQGDAYTVLATNTLWIYDGTAWNDAGVIQGPQGVQGVQGTPGPAGPSGPPGPTGPQGPAGPTGPQGIAGPAGPAGPTGATGATGATGPIGPQGPQGIQGATGPAGPAGSASVVYVNNSGNFTGQGVGPFTFDTFTLPATATAYQVTLAMQAIAPGPTATCVIAPQITVTNPNISYQLISYANGASSNRNLNNTELWVPSTVVAGESGLIPNGQLTFTFQYSGSFQGSSNVSIGWTYTITYW